MSSALEARGFTVCSFTRPCDGDSTQQDCAALLGHEFKGNRCRTRAQLIFGDLKTSHASVHRGAHQWLRIAR